MGDRATGVAYFKSGIGNLIQATPALQALASMDPEGKVDVCMDSGWSHDGRIGAIEEILNACPFVGKIVKFPGVDLEGYEKWFVPTQSENSAAGMFFREKIGPKNWPFESWEKTLAHEADVNMDTVRRVCGYKGPTPAKYAPVAEIKHVRRDIRGPVIGLCNGAFEAEIWDKKRWPHFKDLARVLKLYFDAEIVGVGGHGEMDDVPLDENFCGKLPITESAGVIKECDLFITTDTGCMHIAEALGTQTVALFGPTLASKNAPRGRHCSIIRSPAKCAPCQYQDHFHVCKLYECMESITVPMVMERMRGLIQRKGAPAWN